MAFNEFGQEVDENGMPVITKTLPPGASELDKQSLLDGMMGGYSGYGSDTSTEPVEHTDVTQIPDRGELLDGYGDLAAPIASRVNTRKQLQEELQDIANERRALGDDLGKPNSLNSSDALGVTISSVLPILIGAALQGKKGAYAGAQAGLGGGALAVKGLGEENDKADKIKSEQFKDLGLLRREKLKQISSNDESIADYQGTLAKDRLIADRTTRTQEAIANRQNATIEAGFDKQSKAQEFTGKQNELNREQDLLRDANKEKAQIERDARTLASDIQKLEMQAAMKAGAADKQEKARLANDLEKMKAEFEYKKQELGIKSQETQERDDRIADLKRELQINTFRQQNYNREDTQVDLGERQERAINSQFGLQEKRGETQKEVAGIYTGASKERALMSQGGLATPEARQSAVSQLKQLKGVDDNDPQVQEILNNPNLTHAQLNRDIDSTRRVAELNNKASGLYTQMPRPLADSIKAAEVISAKTAPLRGLIKQATAGKSPGAVFSRQVLLKSLPVGVANRIRKETEFIALNIGADLQGKQLSNQEREAIVGWLGGAGELSTGVLLDLLNRLELQSKLNAQTLVKTYGAAPANRTIVRNLKQNFKELLLIPPGGKRAISKTRGEGYVDSAGNFISFEEAAAQ